MYKDRVRTPQHWSRDLLLTPGFTPTTDLLLPSLGVFLLDTCAKVASLRTSLHADPAAETARGKR